LKEKHIATIAIITAVKSDESGLALTLDSILLQNFQNWKCLIVLGPSIDNTEIVAINYSLRDHRIEFMYEESQGVYGAMNDGINHTHEPYLIFMNAGDSFATNNSLLLLYKGITNGEYDFCIGNFLIDQEVNSRVPGVIGEIELIDFAFNRNWGNHQSMIFRRLSNKMRYDTKFQIAADFKLVLQYLSVKKGRRIDAPIARIQSGGVSDRKLVEGHLEKYRIRREFISGLLLQTANIVWTFLAIVKIAFQQRFMRKL
jgi:glycosyltransferase involved in cell wall biosynthesis